MVTVPSPDTIDDMMEEQPPASSNPVLLTPRSLHIGDVQYRLIIPLVAAIVLGYGAYDYVVSHYKTPVTHGTSR